MDGPWAAVKDNALFTAAEHEAWFLLWDEARRLSRAELAAQANTELTYAQLVNQPDVYRAQPVRVRGRVLRESVKPAPKNSLGISKYHQLVLAPAGGGDWPIMIYCLELPAEFPRGDGLKEDLAMVGLFFKNWSYPYDGGIGLAPVLIAETIDWKPPSIQTALNRPPLDSSTLWIGGAVAASGAGIFLIWVMSQTRRPKSHEASRPDFGQLGTDL
jgi:hypothetical protein